MDGMRIALQAVVVISGLFLVLLILMHKGKGSGLSDMFGGGVSSSLGGSSIAEKNLNRLTILASIIWFLAVIGLGLVARFQ
ncbi:preprotein translocase subunit SecG [Flexivirga sp. B27]